MEGCIFLYQKSRSLGGKKWGGQILRGESRLTNDNQAPIGEQVDQEKGSGEELGSSSRYYGDEGRGDCELTAKNGNGEEASF